MAAPEDQRELTEEEQAAADAAAARKKRRLKIFVGAAIAVLLMGGAVALWFFLKPPPDPAVEAAKAAQKPEAIEQRAIYYPLKEKFVINYDVRGRQRFLQVEVNLMLRDDSAIRPIEQHMPRIRNDLIMLFSGQVFEDLQTPEGKELLRQDALRRVQAVLEQETGKQAIEQVLFTSFVMQ